MAQGHRVDLVLIKKVFFTILTKLSNSRPWYYNLAKIEGFGRYRKYFSIISLAETLTRSYFIKINCKCLR